MYNNDAPIELSSQDLLNRSEFAKNLAQSLIDYQDKSSLCIGLLGPWGSGKTSLINLIINEIYTKSEQSYNRLHPIVLRFNPWHFVSSDQLIQQFFLMLADEFTNKTDSRLCELGKAISDYSSTFSLLPKVGGIASKGAFIFGKLIKNRTVHGAEIEAKRNKIIDLLDKQPNKVIISIDDIDRLSNTEIQLIFQLVNSVASFPNTIFLLSFDKDIVVHALNNYQADDGSKYLEKIIQVVVNVPPTSDAQINEIFHRKFNPLFDQYPQMVWGLKYWNQISPHVFSLIETARDITRLFNTVQLKLSLIGSEINYSDLIMVTILELKKPKFFEWIRNHKTELLNDNLFLDGLNNSGQSTDDWKEHYLHLLKDDELSINADEGLKILALLFPVVADRIGRPNDYSNKSKQMIRDQRIGIIDKFDRYFVLSIGDNQIPRPLLQNAIATMDAERLEAFINDSVNKYNQGNVITEIEALGLELSDERSKILLKSMLKSIKYFRVSREELFYSSAKSRAENLCLGLMEKVGYDFSFEAMKSSIETAEVNDLDGLANLLNIMLISYDRIRKNHGFPKVVAEEQLNELGKLYINKIREIDNNVNLLSLEDFLCISVVKYFDEEEYVKYIKRKFKESELNKLLFMCGFISEGTDLTDGSSIFHISQTSEPSDFISDEEVDKAIETCVRDKSIKKLTKNQALMIAAFSLRNSRENAQDGFTEKECGEVLKKWGYFSKNATV